MDIKNILKEAKGIAITIVGSLMLASLINTKVFAMAKVEQESMENTLYNNERLMLDKFSYNFQTPKRGDIVVFLDNEEKGNTLKESYIFIKEVVSLKHITDTRVRFVKRVIGIPGDEVNIDNGNVYINGEKLNEGYIKGITNIGSVSLPIVIKEGEVFVLGDNREKSNDSRNFGVIKMTQVEGKAIFRIAPLDRFGSIK